MRSRLAPAVFFDKDGTLIHDIAYNVDPSLISWRPGAFDALRRIADAGFDLVLVTNQSGIATGRFTEGQFQHYLEALTEMLGDGGVRLIATEYCPHHPDATVWRYRRFCACRKPNPGMLARAAAMHQLDLHRSWMVGDILDDIEAGGRAGCSTALVTGTYLGEYLPLSGVRRPDVVVDSLTQAAEKICTAATHGVAV